MAEIITASGAVAYGTRIGVVEIPNEGLSSTLVEDGPASVMAVRLSYWRSVARGLNSGIASISSEESGGRTSITIAYERETDDIRNLGVQELDAVDVVRDIKSAPYFATLTNSQVAAVQSAWDNRQPLVSAWSDLQKKLYGHMSHGQESYMETAYTFRQTYQTTSTARLQIAASNPNTVQTLPTLTATLANLINALPAGEWLKKPASVQYAGRKGWTVTLSYQWAPKWSVIYGGTFTGLDA